MNEAIKNRWTGEVIVEAGKYSNIKEAVEKSRADLSGADLYCANLSGANLYCADLYGANLSGANLYGANLSRADLSGADLSGADLSGADLSGANLYCANLSGARNFKLHFQHCPQEGSFIAWKKARGRYLLKIVIPNDAKRTSCVVNRKCRAEYVKTIAVFDPGGNQMPEGFEVRGLHDANTIYQVGRITKADKFDPDIFADCTHGIHFFPTREEAEEWKG